MNTKVCMCVVCCVLCMMLRWHGMEMPTIFLENPIISTIRACSTVKLTKRSLMATNPIKGRQKLELFNASCLLLELYDFAVYTI